MTWEEYDHWAQTTLIELWPAVKGAFRDREQHGVRNRWSKALYNVLKDYDVELCTTAVEAVTGDPDNLERLLQHTNVKPLLAGMCKHLLSKPNDFQSSRTDCKLCGGNKFVKVFTDNTPYAARLSIPEGSPEMVFADCSCVCATGSYDAKKHVLWTLKEEYRRRGEVQKPSAKGTTFAADVARDVEHLRAKRDNQKGETR